MNGSEVNGSQQRKRKSRIRSAQWLQTLSRLAVAVWTDVAESLAAAAHPRFLRLRLCQLVSNSARLDTDSDWRAVQ